MWSKIGKPERSCMDVGPKLRQEMIFCGDPEDGEEEKIYVNICASVTSGF